MEFFKDIFTNIPLLISWAVLLITGLVALYGLFDKKVKDKFGEENTLDDRIRALYKEENAAQEKKITELLNKVDSMQEQIKQLSSENKVMKDIFQGRDVQTVEFQKQGFEAIKSTAEIKRLLLEQKEVSAKNSDGIHAVNKNVERLAKAIERHLEMLENTEKGGEEK